MAKEAEYNKSTKKVKHAPHEDKAMAAIRARVQKQVAAARAANLERDKQVHGDSYEPPKAEK